jgi:hypothetical protein
MADDFLSKIAELVPLGSFRIVRARQYRVAGTERALIAQQAGYILVAGLTHEPTKLLGNWYDMKAVRIFIRCQASDRLADLRVQVGARAEALGFREVEIRIESGHVAREGSPFTPRHDSLALVQRYALKRPSAERTAALLKAALECTEGVIPPLDRACEICGDKSSAEFAMCDGAPGYYCTGCQNETRQRYTQNIASFMSAPAKEGTGRVVGLVAALVLGLGAGAFASQFLFGPISFLRVVIWALGVGLLGAGIMRATILGAGATNPRVLAAGMKLSWIGVMIANVSCYLFAALQRVGTPLEGVARVMSLAHPVWGTLILLAGVWIARYGAAQSVGSYSGVPVPTFESLDSLQAADRGGV